MLRSGEILDIREMYEQGISFTSVEDLNSQAATWRDTVANVRIHATTGVQLSTPVSF